MPYKQFDKKVDGIVKSCIKNINTGKITCFGSKEKRKTGIRMREAFSHGWVPTKQK
jgi:hypothetical protein